mmetsp:Transcript_8978/g.18631  ORF Transcript_8978/g.18631 Transcript_8978/m.18631 type:complete len:545 (-) Transcript_8978:143-1777(-)
MSGSPKSPLLPSTSVSPPHKLERRQSSLDNVDLNTALGAAAGDAATTKDFWLLRHARHHYQTTIAKVPPKYKWLCLFVWVGWKFVAAYLVYYVFAQPSSTSTAIPWVPSILPAALSSDHKEGPLRQRHDSMAAAKVRALYIVSTPDLDQDDMVHHMDNNKTTAGDAPSRLIQHLSTALPLLRHNVATMLQEGYHVDLIWIHGDEYDNDHNYKPLAQSPLSMELLEFYQHARKAFPSHISISFWPRARPWSLQVATGRLERADRLLDQAWWIIRDKFPFYHVFLAWPDTARVLGSHLDLFWTLSQQLLLETPALSSTDQRQAPLVPAFVPAFYMPHGHAPANNNNGTKSNLHRDPQLQKQRELQNQQPGSNQQQWDHWQTTTRLSSAQDLGVGPILSVPQNGGHLTNQTYAKVPTTGEESTVLLPVESMSAQYGFMVTRHQLAQEGLLECLNQPHQIPIAKAISNQNKSSSSSVQDTLPTHACQPPGRLLLTKALSEHVVQFFSSPPSPNGKAGKGVTNPSPFRVSDLLELVRKTLNSGTHVKQK